MGARRGRAVKEDFARFTGDGRLNAPVVQQSASATAVAIRRRRRAVRRPRRRIRTASGVAAIFRKIT
jgi:hypothetical protein